MMTRSAIDALALVKEKVAEYGALTRARVFILPDQNREVLYDLVAGTRNARAACCGPRCSSRRPAFGAREDEALTTAPRRS
jgi:hypothetical protein